MMYKNGFGLIIDYKKSIKLLEIGTNLNDYLCKYYLALFYIDGIYVKKNLSIAKKLLKESSNLGFSPSTILLELFLLDEKKSNLKLIKEEILKKKYIEFSNMIQCFCKALQNDYYNNDVLKLFEFLQFESYLLKNMYIKITERKGADDNQFFSLIKVK
jgi:TPR repeat protein